VRKENSVLKKTCSLMQREIEVLQASIVAASIQRGASKSHIGKSFASQPEDDVGSDEDEELTDVSLFPLEEAAAYPHRPSIIPQLDFSCLSPYSEEVCWRFRIDVVYVPSNVMFAGNDRKMILTRWTMNSKILHVMKLASNEIQ
jgi:hypothetical protein